MSKLCKAYTKIEKGKQKILYKYFLDNSPCVGTCPDRRKGCHGNCEKEAVYLDGYNSLKRELSNAERTEKAIVSVLYSRRKGESA